MNDGLNEEQVTPKPPSSPKELIKTASIAYGVMAFIGFEICWWQHQNIKTLMGPIQYEYNLVIAIIVVATLFLFCCQKLMEFYLPSYRKFKITLRRLFSGVTLWGAIWLAFTSSIAEEILFRGAIQPFLGVWFTSVLFGIMHMDPENGFSPWTVWALIAGLLLGETVIVTGSLWPAILIHFLTNFIGIRSLISVKKQSKLG